MGSVHETNPSLWVLDTPGGQYPALSGSLAVDVAVIGAGVTGLSAALLLQEAGARVAVLEAGRVASGVTGYSTAKVTAQHGACYARLASSLGHDRARRYGQAQQAGLEQVATWVAQRGIDCGFVRAPAFVWTRQPEQVAALREEADAAARLGLPAALATDADAPFAVEAAVVFDGQALFHPRRYCLGLADAVASGGGHVVEHTRATDVRAGDPCVVVTQHGEVTARHVVVATHLPFTDRGGFFAKCHPMRSYCLAVRLAEPAPAGMGISLEQPTRSVRPYGPGQPDVLIVGGEGHKVGHDPDTTRRYAALEEWAREHYPVRSVEARWSAQDYQPVDGVPYVGRLRRGEERVLVATGYRKWGFTNATAAGLVLRDAVTGAGNPWSDLFDASRIDLAPSTREFVTENVDVARRFVGDRLRTVTPPDAGQLAPGQGAIVRLRGRKVAAYRDEDGRLHAVSPTCTHLGCLVTFNTAERSWDCPCHGSRFGIDGRVIQGPAVRDLRAEDER